MEQTINIAGRTYIIPSDRISALVAWLESNAVQANSRQVVREVIGDVNDPRQLLLEN